MEIHMYKPSHVGDYDFIILITYFHLLLQQHTIKYCYLVISLSLPFTIVLSLDIGILDNVK